MVKVTPLGIVIFALCCLSACQPAEPVWLSDLRLDGYQRLDGSITVLHTGDVIDPYFAAKALLIARDGRLNILPAALGWIAWGLAHQRPDGGFDRYCVKDDTVFSCALADAEDSTLAVWIELLARLGPGLGFPPQWTESLNSAEARLIALEDPTNGIYHISGTMRVGLLMDNVEVLTAWRALAEFYRQKGDTTRSSKISDRADRLAVRILSAFWDSSVRRFRVSTQERKEYGFYPDEVGQVFPFLGELVVPDADRNQIYFDWMTHNRPAWLESGKLDYPWGLVAIVADKMGDRTSVVGWVTQASALRNTKRWNVLEEAVYQVLLTKLVR